MAISLGFINGVCLPFYLRTYVRAYLCSVRPSSTLSSQRHQATFTIIPSDTSGIISLLLSELSQPNKITVIIT